MTAPVTHGSWVTWVMGQELSGSLGSWVTLSDPFPALMELTFSYSDVFYTQNLSLTFSQPSINLFMFFIDRYNLTVIG